MGKASRDKGKRGERELASELRRLGIRDARRGVQYRGGPESPDVDGIPGVHIECKRTEALSLYAAMKQASREADALDVPVVMHRRSGQRWLAIVELDLLPALAKRILEEIE